MTTDREAVQAHLEEMELSTRPGVIHDGRPESAPCPPVDAATIRQELAAFFAMGPAPAQGEQYDRQEALHRARPGQQVYRLCCGDLVTYEAARSAAAAYRRAIRRGWAKRGGPVRVAVA